MGLRPHSRAPVLVHSPKTKATCFLHGPSFGVYLVVVVVAVGGGGSVLLCHWFTMSGIVEHPRPQVQHVDRFVDVAVPAGRLSCWGLGAGAAGGWVCSTSSWETEQVYTERHTETHGRQKHI